jgi:hypothetical protein
MSEVAEEIASSYIMCNVVLIWKEYIKSRLAKNGKIYVVVYIV